MSKLSLRHLPSITSRNVTLSPKVTTLRVDILGVLVTPDSFQGAVDRLVDWIRQRSPTYICVTGVHGVMEARRDPALREIHNAAGMVTTDGMPLVWASRWVGVKHAARVYGPDLVLGLCEAGLDEGWRHYFYGAAPGVADEMAARLVTRFPRLQIAGTFAPPFRALSAEEEDGVAALINGSGADIVWVGLSTPKQERWMATMRTRLEAPLLVGVGAAFDIHAGRLRQAPRWVQRSGLEWLFRLAMEPRRLWKRYLRNNPRFVIEMLRRPPQLIIVNLEGSNSSPTPDLQRLEQPVRTTPPAPDPTRTW